MRVENVELGERSPLIVTEKVETPCCTPKVAEIASKVFVSVAGVITAGSILTFCLKSLLPEEVVQIAGFVLLVGVPFCGVGYVISKFQSKTEIE